MNSPKVREKMNKKWIGMGLIISIGVISVGLTLAGKDFAGGMVALGLIPSVALHIILNPKNRKKNRVINNE